MRPDRWAPLILLGCLMTSCAVRHTTMGSLGTPCGAAAASLNGAWRNLDEAMEAPGGCIQDGGNRCEALRLQVERLMIDCPSNPEVLMANALLAFQVRELTKSQQLLDQTFSLQPVYPQAAVLRARIALVEGNVPFAQRFLDQQIRQSSDYAPLRETYASALYLAKRWDDARAQLQVASRLGAPAWRVAYSLGLIDEAVGRTDDAKQRYREALEGKPGWNVAESRLRALDAAR